MKIIFSLLAFFFFALSHAQSDFDKGEIEIKKLNEEGNMKRAFQMLNILRRDKWESLNCREQTIVYKLFGNTHYYLYEDDRALNYYVDSCYQKAKECNLKSLEIDLLNNIGSIYLNAGQQLLAGKYFSKLREYYLSKELRPTHKAFDHLTNLASFYHDYGNLYNSFLCAWKAKGIGEKLKLNLGKVYNLLGIYFEETKQYDEAIINYDKALQYALKGNKSLVPSILTNQVYSYRIKKNYKKCLEIIEQVKQYNQTDEDYYALLNIEALIYSDQGEFEKSEQIFAKMDKMNSSNTETINYHRENQADLKVMKGDYSGASKIYKQLISDIEKKWSHINYVPATSSDLLELTDLRTLLSESLYLDSRAGNPNSRKEVIENYRFLRFNVNQIVKSNWESTSSSFLLDDFYPKLYSIILSHLGEYEETKNKLFLETAYQILSEFKNQILERDIQSRMQLRETFSDSVLSQFYQLKSDLNVQIAKEKSSEKSQLEIIQEFERYQLRFDSILTNEDSFLTLKPKSLTEIQEFLGKNQAHLDLYYANEKLIRFWITNNEVKVSNIELVNDLLFEFLNGVRSGSPIHKPTNDAIYNALFANVDLGKIKTVTIHADGLFHKLPLGAIRNPTSQRFLIEDFSFRYLLSTDSIYTENYNWEGSSCLGVASEYNLKPQQQIDTFSIDISQLTGTIEELTDLFKYYNTDSLINEKASFDNLSELISKNNYNIVQLSMHGVLDDRYPALSGLIFENENGIERIDLNKMTGLNLNTDLTIINSCHSGDGKHISGEALSNLNTSLFIGGSKANIVNLWSSSDKASAEILKNFHKQLSNGLSKSEALQMAKKEYLATASPSYKHPKYWSSLVLFGNDAPLSKKNFNLLHLLLILFAVSIIFLLAKNFLTVRK